MSQQENRWADVASAITERMAELGIADQAELIRVSGLSDATVRGLMNGKPRSARVRANTDALLCRALRWRLGSLIGLLDGLPPQADHRSTPTKQPLTLEQLAARIEARFAVLERRLDQQAEQLTTISGLGASLVGNLNHLVAAQDAAKPDSRSAQPRT